MEGGGGKGACLLDGGGVNFWTGGGLTFGRQADRQRLACAVSGMRQATLSFGRTLSLSTGAIVTAAPPEMEISEADSFCPSPSNQSLQSSTGGASAQSSTSSVLSSAEAYTRRAAAGAGKRGATASDVRVVLALRFLSCQGLCLGVVASLSLKRVAVT